MILGFDTTTDWLTVALGTAEQVTAKFNGPAPRRHLNRLLPTINSLLNEAGAELADIDHIAVGVGPGSFTGVRIAVATAQGLAHALKAPLIGVSTLDTIAAGAAGEAGREIFAILDAKRREVYTATYDERGRRLTPYRVMAPAALAEELADRDRPALLVGDGTAVYEAIFRKLPDQAATLGATALSHPNGEVLIELAEERIDKGHGDPYFKVLPIYIRLSDAEENSKRAK